MDGLQMEPVGQTGEQSGLECTQATTYTRSGSQVRCGPISLIYEARSDCGRVRSKNEDALILAPSSGLFGVCDGMGGYAAGEIASDIASTTLVNCLDVPGSQPAITLETAILEADRRIIADQEDCPAHRRMGTTLTALWIGQDRSPLAWIGHVGDSRIYRYRNGVLSQLTDDHSMVFELYKAGVFSKEQARVHPRSKILTQSLGCSSDLTPDIISIKLDRGDRLLICTDGLSDLLSDDEMSTLLGLFPLGEAADQLLAGADGKGARDNISFILVEISHVQPQVAS